MIVIVPNELRDAINRKLDTAFEKMPEAEKEREQLFHQLLKYFDEYGEIPDFELIKKPYNNGMHADLAGLPVKE